VHIVEQRSNSVKHRITLTFFVAGRKRIEKWQIEVISKIPSPIFVVT
jgi:hypothetical protein